MSKMELQAPDLSYLNLKSGLSVKYQLSAAELVKEALQNNEGTLASSGALAVDTGKFTGRSPKDRFIVCDDITDDVVWWGDVNIKFSPENFDGLLMKMTDYLNQKTIFVRDSSACANPDYSISIRVITETAYQNLFAKNLFIRPEEKDLGIRPEWTIIAAPGFLANPAVDGTRQENFSIINFTRKMILVGGTGYTGEIKKGIFSVLNFLLPVYKNTLSMHCSANVGEQGDSAIFFGLSGTGKTTLSADPKRALIGDDEHGWGTDSIFNFEGGCYAKCVDLTLEKEPQIYKAIKFGSLLENVNFYPERNEVDFSNIEKTENTRVAYPIGYIDNAVLPSVASAPKNIFFLTADAFGVLPPISKLNTEQAMFHFLSGYTAKVAGTETGITEPQLTFSACFGKAFLPLHPTKYAELLGKKIEEQNVNVWLVNTGWSGGAYGVGKRMKLSYTRAMITAALNGELNHNNYKQHHVFKLMMPLHCPNVPDEILDPSKTWNNQEEYFLKAYELADAFTKNFKQFEEANEPKFIQEALKMC
ncbi:phosphoenolpyruvate carboxykinase (ATP) [Pedobacter mendelii]|uniref:Phosphoenolpyruvate carboxykinase (ATP) n=1 Tax=Pedobacter mendelii TaxID=1908240 RepID=A0ABQ2BK25_9SPHI|nr:phosphoenolpyruvate carboxykinase (ATP) [Pedobacter mendelii]GGI28003.1 phosphoenolpyruvate carboxykinase [ATP] [Pedobacter mendelii]